jgi:AMMECR1 domain-containing protein
MTPPKLSDLELSSEDLSTTKWSCFVTIFHNGEVRGSAGNIKEMETSLWAEIIANTIHAISKDTRFTPLAINEAKEIKIRVDFIKSRKVIAHTQEQENSKDHKPLLTKIDPVKNGVIVIKKDYAKTATILPNIDPKILVWDDYYDILSRKLKEEFEDNNYIIYQIETIIESDY